MPKKLYICLFLLVTSFLFTGCSNNFDAMPDLTEEQEKQIVHYIAGIMIKHDKNYGKLEEDYVIRKYDETEAQKKANLEAFLASKPEKQESEENISDEKHASSDNGQDLSTPVRSIEDTLGLYDFSIAYDGFSISPSYPEDASGDAFFALDASPGNLLLVAHFRATNTSSQDSTLDIFSSKAKFKIAVEGLDEKNAMTTLLIDDMGLYRGDIAAGDYEDLVLVREIPESFVNSVTSVTVSLVTSDGKFLIQ